LEDLKWEDNIKMHPRETVSRCDGYSSGSRMQWEVLVQTVMNLQSPLKVGNFLTSKRPLLHAVNDCTEQVSW